MTLLVLAGTTEARALVEALAAEGLPVVASLAGATATPRPLPVETWRGGFGGAGAMAARLRDAGISATIDATHPFAARISARTVEVCAALGLPRLALVRPEWREPRAGAWRRHPDLAAAVAALPAGARVLAALGAGGARAFDGRPDLSVLLRAVAPPPDLPPHVRALAARPPWDLAAERALMAQARVGHLVTKNAGGPASAKLEAARELGVTIHMIDRPPPPPGPVATSVAAAADWARVRLGAASGEGA